jgi:hypothetical protein
MEQLQSSTPKPYKNPTSAPKYGHLQKRLKNPFPEIAVKLAFILSFL